MFHRMLLVATLLAVAFVSPTPAAEVTAEQLKLLKTFREEFLAITPGEGKFPASFTMGRADGDKSERPPHTVTIGHKFEIAKYEVPQNLWEAVTGANPSRWKGVRNSVEMLDYFEALDFCRQATALMHEAKLIDDDQVVTLPTEAIWEYVARAGSKTVYSFGDDAALLKDFAWFTGNAAGNDPAVGVKKPNDWQLYDVHGYLWEWCMDSYHENYDGAPADGSVWSTPGDDGPRVLRGGSWKDPDTKLTSSYRRSAPITLKDDAVGLRCVLIRRFKPKSSPAP